MDIRIEWDGTEKGKQALVEQYDELRLKEEQRYIDGNWLIFTDEPYEEPETTNPPRDLAVEIDNIMAKLKEKNIL